MLLYIDGVITFQTSSIMMSTSFEEQTDYGGFKDTSSDAGEMTDRDGNEGMDKEIVVQKDVSLQINSDVDNDSLWGDDSDDDIPLESEIVDATAEIMMDIAASDDEADDIENQLFASPSKPTKKTNIKSPAEDFHSPGSGSTDVNSGDMSESESDADEKSQTNSPRKAVKNTSTTNTKKIEPIRKTAAETEVEVGSLQLGVSFRCSCHLSLQAVKKIESGPTEAELRRRQLIEM